MIRDVKRDPFVPHVWTKNEPGMQGYTLLDDRDANLARTVWHDAMTSAVNSALTLVEIGAHKQIANRLLMPFMYITVLISSTKWSNFLALRLHKTAEPHMRILADHIDHELRTSVPVRLSPDGLHLPFVTEDEQATLPRIDKIRLSVARCASTSYKTVDGFDMGLDRAKAIHDSLVSATPCHASPAEHVAMLPGVREVGEGGNFGDEWIQYRKTLPHENITDEDWLKLRVDEDYRIHAFAPPV